MFRLLCINLKHREINLTLNLEGDMTYLEKVQRDTSTKFWVNNPSIDECDVAIANGAFSCTTNPSYCAKLFQSDPTYIRKKIKTILDKPTKNVSIAEQVYHSTTKDLMDRF